MAPRATFDDVSARPEPTGKRAANSGVIFRFDCYLHEFIAVLIGDGDCRTPIVIPVLGKFGSNFFCVGGRILLRVEAFAVLIHEFNVAVTDDVEKIPAHPRTPQQSRSQPIARLNRLSRCMCRVERARIVASGRALTEWWVYYATCGRSPFASRTAARSASRALRNSWPSIGLKRCEAAKKR